MCIKKTNQDKEIALFQLNFLKTTTWYKITVTFRDSWVTTKKGILRGDVALAHFVFGLQYAQLLQSGCFVFSLRVKITVKIPQSSG